MKPIAVIAVVVLMTNVTLAAQKPTDPLKTPPIGNPPSPTYPTPAAQNVDPAVEQLVKAYESALNKQDAKAVAALYTDNAVHLGPNNQVIRGRDAIEGFFVSSFAGTSKPPTVTVRPGRIEMLTPDVAVTEGTYEVAGTNVNRGIYVLTAVRQSGRWKMASVVPVPDVR